MNPAGRLAGFAAVVLLCFGVAFGIGVLVGPIDVRGGTTHGHDGTHGASTGAPEKHSSAPVRDGASK